MANNYSINYDLKLLHLNYEGVLHEFDLTDGDVGDFWHSFPQGDKMYDINFHQETSLSNPSLEVYECKKDGNGLWNINTMDYEIIPLASYTGNPDNYFGTIKYFSDADGNILSVLDKVVVLNIDDLEGNLPRRADVITISKLVDVESNYIEFENGSYGFYGHRVLKLNNPNHL